MMRQFFRCAALFLAFSTLATTQKKVKVTVYYDSLNNASQQFIVNQLYPLYTTLGGWNVCLDLLPYGKTTYEVVGGNWIYKCPGGPDECFLNKIQSCILLEYPPLYVIEFLKCLVEKPSATEVQYMKECASKLLIPWSDMERCIRKGMADSYLFFLSERTKQAKLQNVPMVWFDDKYDKVLEERAFKDLIKVTCELFPEKPNRCLKYTKG